jgi:CRP-like cAMP-binding protein
MPSCASQHEYRVGNLIRINDAGQVGPLNSAGLETETMSSKLTAGDLQVITRVAVFRALKPETVQHIIAPASAALLRPHETIMRQDDPATAFFIVIDGWMKISRNTQSGGETVIDMMRAGDSFAEAAAFSGGRYIATAEAVSMARVARIPADHLIRCIRESPDIALAMIASTSQRMRYLVQQVEQLKAQSGVQRVAEFLASLSLVEQGRCALALPYDKILIAGRLGLTPESLSRAFAKLRGVGVTINASQVSVKDIVELRRIAADDRTAVRGTLRPVRCARRGSEAAAQS